MMRSKTGGRNLAVASALAMSLFAAAPAANAQTIIDEWKSVAVPAAPPLKPATVDSASSALLIFDVLAANCTEATRPRCVKTLPQIERLLKEVRAHKMLVVYSAGPATSTTPPNPAPSLTNLPGDPMIRAGADKWLGSDLEKTLAAKNIKTVIVVGTSAEGAVLYGASGAALRGLTAVVPVDGMSSPNPFAELYTAWHLTNSPATITSHVILTKTDMITFQ